VLVLDIGGFFVPKGVRVEAVVFCVLVLDIGGFFVPKGVRVEAVVFCVLVLDIGGFFTAGVTGFFMPVASVPAVAFGVVVFFVRGRGFLVPIGVRAGFVVEALPTGVDLGAADGTAFSAPGVDGVAAALGVAVPTFF